MASEIPWFRFHRLLVPDRHSYVLDSVFVFEFKLNGTAEEAMEQIDAKGYPLPYLVTGKKTVKLAVEFDKAARNLGRWLIA